MKIKHLTKTHSGFQDGAIFGDLLFRFNARGLCEVYDLAPLLCRELNEESLEPIASFKLDKSDMLVPHSNAVVFGAEYFDDGDEFPLLYSNIYNNYAKADNSEVGVCCVYRLTRAGDGFKTTLVQVIEVGFTDNKGLWRSEEGVDDVRPYGNFVIGRESNRYYAFVMRNGDKSTRYFAFDLPRVTDGCMDEALGVKRVVLGTDDILDYFDAPYHNYIQGASLSGCKVYSVEGFHGGIHPALRIIDIKEKKEDLFFDFFEAGFTEEAEFIDFHRGNCYYGDAKGNIFLLEF